MNEHLPECPMLEPCSADTTQHCYCSRRNTCIHDEMECICERLRTCEERVIAAAVQRVQALPHALECVTRDVNYSRPCNCLRGDALDAIKGDSDA